MTIGMRESMFAIKWESFPPVTLRPSNNPFVRIIIIILSFQINSSNHPNLCPFFFFSLQIFNWTTISIVHLHRLLSLTQVLREDQYLLLSPLDRLRHPNLEPSNKRSIVLSNLAAETEIEQILKSTLRWTRRVRQDHRQEKSSESSIHTNLSRQMNCNSSWETYWQLACNAMTVGSLDSLLWVETVVLSLEITCKPLISREQNSHFKLSLRILIFAKENNTRLMIAQAKCCKQMFQTNVADNSIWNYVTILRYAKHTYFTMFNSKWRLVHQDPRHFNNNQKSQKDSLAKHCYVLLSPQIPPLMMLTTV